MKKIKRKINIIIILIPLLIIFLFVQNNSIQLTKLNITIKDLPDSLEGYKILHISDLHSKSFGNNQSMLVQKIKRTNPDIIVVSGDTIDVRKYNENSALSLLGQIRNIPIYLVTGNHEYWSNRFNQFEKKLENISVIVLRNELETITVGDGKINIVGIDDKSFFGEISYENAISKLSNGVEDDGLNILLAHRPDYINEYSKYNYDVVFSGHAHGGQIRLPFIGGLFAPNQGAFPKYTEGKHTVNNTTIIISRGLGNSVFPQRIFNRPEIILVTLNKEVGDFDDR